MCGGALYWSQISKVVYGASDEKRGFKAKIGELHPKTEIVSGNYGRGVWSIDERIFPTQALNSISKSIKLRHNFL